MNVSDKLDSLVQSLAAGQNRPAASEPHPAVRQNAQSAAQQPQPPADANDPAVAAAVEKIDKELQTQNSRLSLSVDKDTNRILIRYKDPQSGEVIRQIPTDTVLAMMKRLDKFTGLMLNSKG